jgi:hypothetical protein
VVNVQRHRMVPVFVQQTLENETITKNTIRALI